MFPIQKLPFHGKLCCMLVIIITIFFAVQAHAEIATDGTLGPALNLTGPNFRVGPEVGTTVGTNLFHSFQRFNVNSTESATFTGPDTIHNVISRVTGGSASTIDGLLRSEVRTADFYFINPAGVVFGPNARVDVPAAFHVSTADELRFAGGSVFSATNPAASTLTAETPESFGYLGSRSASLVLNGSQLSLAPGSSVSLSGGNVTVQGDETRSAKISVPGGELRISAVGNTPDNVSLTGALNAGGGSLQVSHARIETSGDDGGEMRIGAGDATVNDAELYADNNGATNGTGGIDIAIGGSIEVNHAGITSDVLGAGVAGGIRMNVTGQMSVLNGGWVQSDTFSSCNAGDVNIEAGRLRIDRQGSSSFTGITSQAASGSSGNAGTVTVKVADFLEVLNGGAISSSTSASGDAGAVNIETGSLRIDGQGTSYTRIVSDAIPGSSGNAGTVTVNVADLLEVLNGGAISSSTFASGDAEDVNIEAGRLRIDRQGSSSFTGITCQAASGSSGNAGTVTINVADLLEVLNGGAISSSTFASGDAGDVNIEAGRLRIDRQGSSSFTGITSQAASGSSGNAGTVAINVVDLLEVLNGGEISNGTAGTGNGGQIEIQAGNLLIDGRDISDRDYFSYSSIDSSTNNSGNGGTIKIKVVDLLELLTGGQISSMSGGSGNSGRIEIEAGRFRMEHSEGSYKWPSVSTVSYYGTGDSGDIKIKVTSLLEMSGQDATILSSTRTIGDAGNVEIEAGSIRLENGASISSQCDGQSYQEPFRAGPTWIGAKGNAGNVTVSVSGKLEILNNAEISTSTLGFGDAGNLKIQAGELLIDNFRTTDEECNWLHYCSPNISSSSKTLVYYRAQGFAGNIDIETGKLTIKNGGTISIESGQAVAEEQLLEAKTIYLFIKSQIVALDQGAQITSESTGNISAGQIRVEADKILISGDSTITTSSTDASGGPITLQGDIIDLRDSLITSSVTGTTGDGGNITIKGNGPATNALILQGGFIQANAPAGARGGNIFIDTRAVIPEGGNLEVGGLTRQSFVSGSGRNIIQAAAPGGEQGTIQITSPDLDISGSLVSLDVRLSETTGLAADPCLTAGSAEGSSLIFAGPGRVSTETNQYVVLSFEGDRLDKVLMPDENLKGLKEK